MSRPVVGVVAGRHRVPRPWGVLPVQGVTEAFPDVVAAAGGLPVVLPMTGLGRTGWLDAVDALLLAGGGDLYPATYGDPVSEGAEVDRGRDQVADRARERGPSSGACRCSGSVGAR